MTKLPSWQFYPGDWRKDPGVQALDYESRGIWFEMLLLMFESEERGKLLLNGKKMPEEALAQILGLEVAKLRQTVSKLLTYGVASICQKTGALMNRRMSKDEDLRRRRVAAGSLGGKQKASNSSAKRLAISTPSSSSSSSSSSSLKNNNNNKSEIFSKIQDGNGGTPAWPSDGQFVHDFLTQQRYLASHCPPIALQALDDPVWWENLSHGLGGLSVAVLDREFALMANWLGDHPPGPPTGEALRQFISRWLTNAAKTERTLPLGLQKLR